MKSLILMILLVVNHVFALDMIANPSVTQTEISASDIKEIYLGNKGTWQDGASMNVGMIANQVVLAGFLTKYIDMPYRMFDFHWKQTVFSGKAVQPKKFANDAEMIQFVSSTPGAIGFVEAVGDAKNVKVLTVK